MWYRRFAPNALVILILLLLGWSVSGGLGDVTDTALRSWLGLTRDQGNAASVQASSAAIQAVGTIVLLVLTWITIRSNERIAREARKSANVETMRARESEQRAWDNARAQQLLSTLPILWFRNLRVTTNFDFMVEFSFDIHNYGHGIALLVRTDSNDDYETSRGLSIDEGRYGNINIEDGSFVSIRGSFIFTDEQIENYKQPEKDMLDPDDPNIVRFPKVYTLGTISTTYFDIQGNSWRFSDDLVAMLEGQNPRLTFINPVPSYPDQYIDPKRKRPWPKVGAVGSPSQRGMSDTQT